MIVDSFGSPTIQNDLGVFDQTFGLPAPPSFKIITPDGPVNQQDPSRTLGWAIETSLDVEYSHAMAPGANILLVETPVAETEGVVGFPQIVEAENYVIKHHLGDVITQSFGATEQSFQGGPAQLLSQRSAYINAARHNVSVLASSGDTGAANYQFDGTDFFPFPAVSWPASDPLVTGVGGTRGAAGQQRQPDRARPSLERPRAGLRSTVRRRRRPVVGVRPALLPGRRRGVVGNSRGVPDVSLNAAVSWRRWTST